MIEAKIDKHLQQLSTKPEGDGIKIFASDWNKDYWSFYAHIGSDEYEQDLEHIISSMDKLNFRDGDTYVELIDFSGNVDHFYHYLYDRGKYTHAEVLDKRYWDALDQRGNEHFQVLRHCFGSDYHNGPEEVLEEDAYSVFSDWHDALETFQPELYQDLVQANALDYFDINRYFSGDPSTKLNDGSIVFTW